MKHLTLSFLALMFVSSFAYADVDNTAFDFSGCGQITSLTAESATVLMPGNDEFLLNKDTDTYNHVNGKWVATQGSDILKGYQEGQCVCLQGSMPDGAPLFRLRSYVHTYETSLVSSASPVDCSAQKAAEIVFKRTSDPDSTSCGDLGCLGGGFGHM
jgi:hypothetical protein